MKCEIKHRRGVSLRWADLTRANLTMRRAPSTIPTWELQKDRLESLADIIVCQAALEKGLTHYSGGSIADRIETNTRIIAIIETELKDKENL